MAEKLAFKSLQGSFVDTRKTYEQLDINNKWLSIQSGCTVQLIGPSRCGKSTFISQLLKHKERSFSDKFERIIFCIPPKTLHLKLDYFERVKQSVPHLEICEGLPTMTAISCMKNSLLIIEDMYDLCVRSRTIFDCFIHTSHHNSLTLICSAQQPYMSGPFSTSISRNAQYKVIWRDYADESTFVSMGRAIFPHDPLFLLRAIHTVYKINPENFLKYLFIDTSQLCKMPNNMRVRCNFFSDTPIFFFSTNQATGC